ncbi:hypothetical protein FALBO_13377 [Fusarium albosuccineum]|uniref:Uncharacterized protein n=1 Tax=Fusarium albosuccineum TaxID=1237068 RepID=A0A8H4L0S6_9HYPO|nr:hypothetical protein FALBO_13377 [Fusarium albosuccineum]KAF5007072.1 hypothetical protein FDECE_6576 [Fusarium decemcellulare]
MGCFCSKEKTPASGAGAVFGAVSGAARYEDQALGRKPKYYNPISGSEHVRETSATWEEYPGKYIGRPKPVPRERVKRPAVSSIPWEGKRGRRLKGTTKHVPHAATWPFTSPRPLEATWKQ